MSSAVKPSLTEAQIAVWLRGLLSVAWADGHYDAEEQALIADLTQNELAGIDLGILEPVAPEELAQTLGHDPQIAENFLRTAVMVAVADGVYSSFEDELLHRFCQTLEQNFSVLEGLRATLYHPQSSIATEPATELHSAHLVESPHHSCLDKVNPLRPVQEWLDQMEIHDPRVARFLCKMIPPQCPFERDIELFGRKVVHIPPLCKLNPLYEQLVGLRFRSLSYLADECGEDVTPYC